MKMYRSMLLSIPHMLVVVMCGQNVEVISGYTDNNRYKLNDSLHVYALDLNPNMVFDTWQGNTQHLGQSKEWHSKLRHTNQAVRLTAVYKANNILLQRDQIQGRDRSKEIWYGVPANPRGIVWLFHGAGSAVNNWVSRKEGRKVADYFLAHGYGVIIMEAEETSLGRDLDGNGKIGWSVAVADSNQNVDIKNLLLVRQEFVRRRLFGANTPQFSLGMSNGGNFSAVVSHYLSFRGGSAYCAAGDPALFDVSRTPFQWCLADFDNSLDMGFAGNQRAQSNHDKLARRNVKTDIYILQPSPMAPGRVRDATGLGLDTINQFLSECIKERIIDTFKIPVLFSKDGFDYAVFDYPARFPSVKLMNSAQLANLFNVWAICFSEHQFYSDAMHRTLRFFDQQIGVNTQDGLPDERHEPWMVSNTVKDEIQVKDAFVGHRAMIYHTNGQLSIQIPRAERRIQIGHLISGNYIACLDMKTHTYCEKITKLP